jgi:hypothetical protein
MKQTPLGLLRRADTPDGRKMMKLLRNKGGTE